MRKMRILAATLLALAAAPLGHALAEPVKNVVIVHGALADGSSWRKVFDLLTTKGFTVTVVQPPMTSLGDDVAATKRILDLQDGPSVLVGHSYGGMIVTEAGTSENVAGLVYVAAFQPDAGETLLDLAARKPAATKGIAATDDGYLYLDPEVFAADFAADVPEVEARFMAHSQVFPAKSAFETKITAPAWPISSPSGISRSMAATASTGCPRTTPISGPWPATAPPGCACPTTSGSRPSATI